MIFIYTEPVNRHPYPFAKQPDRTVRQGPSRVIQDLLANALRHHQAGRLTEAERIYRQILAVDAHHADSLHLLGMLTYQSGRHEVAVEMIRKAIAARKNEASFHSNLGNVLLAQGKLEEAAECYEWALALKPNYAEAHTNLGTVLQAQGRLDEARARYERALALKPDFAEAQANLGTALYAQGKLNESVAWYERALALKPDCAEVLYNLGNTLQAQGRLDEARARYERALALKPNYAEAHGNLGLILQAQGKLDEARACCDRALALKPDYAEVHTNLGSILHAQGKLDEAVASHERALLLKPKLPEAHYNLGNALQSQDKPDEALACYERAQALKPDYAEALYNWGCALYALGNLDQALGRYRKALALQPDYAQARFSESLAQLLGGNFDSGWHNYEWRWQTKEFDTPLRAYPQPRWTGEKLSSGRLLIWGEQGIGDEIMFAGLIPDVIRTGNRCVLDCDARLKPLFARSFPSIDVVSSRAPGPNPEPDFGAHLPSGSLPGLFRATHAAFVTTTSSYLIADPVERERFRARYADGRRLVGLAWHTKNRKTGRNRSIDLSLFAPLFAQPDVRWINLQYGDHDAMSEQIAAASAPILIDRSVDQFSNIDVFAAQIAAMDMVLTIDNSTAHLAGALGVPTWVLLPFAPDWRWLQLREDSPWYPTMRLFRQPKIGDWQSVVNRVHSILQEQLYPPPKE